MSTHESKLDGPADWESWRRQFQSLARATDLWRVVQGLETPIEKPDRPKFSSYPRAAAATQSQTQTCSKSLAAEDSQSTVQETQGPTDFAHLSAAGQKAYTGANSIYENELKAYSNIRNPCRATVASLRIVVANRGPHVSRDWI